MPTNIIDLNSDVGESFGNYKLGLDEEVIPLISSANVACGFHAGDPAVMKGTIKIARDNRVAIGATRDFRILWVSDGAIWMLPWKKFTIMCSTRLVRCRRLPPLRGFNCSM